MFIKKNDISYIRNFFLFFIIAKGITFLAPVFFIKFITVEQYGVIEYSFAIGSVAAVALMLGLGGAYPYFILKKEEKNKEEAFFLYGLIIFILFVIAVSIYYSHVISKSFYLIFLFSSIFSLQRLYSSILKCNDKGNIGSLYDSGYFFVLLLVILACIITKVLDPLILLQHLMEVYLLGLIAIFILEYVKKKKQSLTYTFKHDYPEILHYSIHLVISGIIIYGLTSCSRIFIKIFMNYEQVGIYSFYFRMVAISVAIYQFCYIAYFKKLYLSNANKLDKYYAFIMFVILCCCLLCSLCRPLLNKYLLNGHEIAYVRAKLFLLLCVQMPIWVGISFNEGIISRENLVSRMNLVLGIIVLAFPVLLYCFKSQMNLELFTFLNIVIFCAAYFSQLQILKSKGINLRVCALYNYFSLSLSFFIFFI